MKKTVMVVDDSPHVTLSVKHGLEDIDKNYNVVVAESGEQCLELLKEEKPDLILLDIMMPGISGWETYDKLKENNKWKDIPIVFLTARTDRVSENAGKFLGDDYVEKPFEIDDLAKRIEENIMKKKNI
ncbi:MAG: response regulator [Candidatus Thermoplasmatota archaeon]